MMKRLLAFLLIAACLLPSLALATKYDATMIYMGEIPTEGVIFKPGDRFTGKKGISAEVYYADANGQVVHRGNNKIIAVTIDGEKVTEWSITEKSGSMIMIGNMVYQAAYGFTMQPTYTVPDSEGFLSLQGKTYRLCSENSQGKKVKFVGKVTDTVDGMSIVTIEENAVVAIKADTAFAADDRVICKGTIGDYQDYSGSLIPVIDCEEASVQLYDPLKKGDKGEEVKKMKERLRDLGYFRAGSEITDAYNDTCADRVKQFQQKNGLTPTGNADVETLTLLYSDAAVGNQ